MMKRAPITDPSGNRDHYREQRRQRKHREVRDRGRVKCGSHRAEIPLPRATTCRALARRNLRFRLSASFVRYGRETAVGIFGLPK